MKQKVLFLDRSYIFEYIKTDLFEPIFVALTKERREYFEKKGYNVIGCFEEQFDELNEASFDNDYLIHSYVSDRFLNCYDIKMRETILGKSITFWRNILDEYKPKCIVNEICTMEWVEVLYIEAQKRHIPYNAFLYGFRPGYTIWLDTPFSSRISERRIEQALPTMEDKKLAISYYQNIKEKHEKPYYIQNLKSNVVRNFLSSLRFYVRMSLKYSLRKGFVYERYDKIARDNVKCCMSRFLAKYDKFEAIDTQRYEYVYYPIHYEPEATINYFGDPFLDQVDVIEKIALSIGTKQVLIIKEHPQQPGMLVSRRFQELKEKCSNIMYLKSTVSSYDVLKKISLMVTLNGTAGLEAMILDKPVIVIGSVFYDCCKCATKCDNIRDLRRIIRNREYNMPDKETLIDFIARYFSLQTKGYPAANYTNSVEENIVPVISQISNFCKE